MRLWSIHPKYLDTKGLLALWREALLAKHVLEGKTKGYKNHPQLNRFKKHKQSIKAIHFFLSEVWAEANSRGYRFDKSKFNKPKKISQIFVNRGQLDYEWGHLQKKLKNRSIEQYKLNLEVKKITIHSLFKVKKGEIEEWEIIN